MASGSRSSGFAQSGQAPQAIQTDWSSRSDKSKMRLGVQLAAASRRGDLLVDCLEAETAFSTSWQLVATIRCILVLERHVEPRIGQFE